MADSRHLEIARAGKSVWNAWRKENPSDHADFSGTDFGSADYCHIVFSEFEFGESANFRNATFCGANFFRAQFGAGARFDGAMFVDGANFEESVFGDEARFEGASFDTAIFDYSAFGRNPIFNYAVFAERVQFNCATFGDYAWFKGTAFGRRAWFDNAQFGDCASFEAHVNEAEEPAESWPKSHRRIYLDRAKAADPSGFQEISFCEARFGFARCTREKVTLGLPQRLLGWSPHGRQPQYIGANFTGRTIHRMGDFSRVRFDQPPAFRDLSQADNLDLAGVVFRFRGWAWPQWQYWTTRTDIATRLRRLRRLAIEIQAVDAERDLFILERMAERGIAWSSWWANAKPPWDRHWPKWATEDETARRLAWRRGLAWLCGAATVAWFALRGARGAGRPAVLTVLTFCYRFLSDFGRSVVLPTVWFIVSLFAFGFLYGTYISGGMSSKPVKTLATFTLANAIPFLGASRQAFGDSAAVLFTRVPEGVHLIALIHGLVSAVLLFLIILALREHFRIR